MKTQSNSISALLGALCASVLLTASPLARAWGEGPIKIIVPAPAGGTIDVVARVLSDELAREIRQPVIVDNKPGAGGVVAVQTMRSAPADGHTLMVTASNLLTEVPHVVKLNYDPLKDIRPVTVIARTGLVLVSAPGMPAKDVKSLVAYVKANPGKVSYASYSAGTASHFAGIMLNQAGGLDMQHVPFPGSPPALAQVLGGQIPIMFDGMPTSLPMIKAGKLHAYGVTSRTRSPYLPDVPTMAEQGYPDMDFGNWLGVVAASNVPADVLDQARAALAKVAASPAVRDRLMAAGFEVGIQATPEQISQSIRVDFDRNAAIIKKFGVTLN